VAACVYPCLGVVSHNPQQADKGRKVLMSEVLSQLNKHLEGRTFLVSQRLTNADLTVACNLLLPFEHLFDPKVRQGHAHATRWFTTVLNQKAALQVLGSAPKMCTAESKPTAAGGAKQQKGGKGDGGKKAAPAAAKKDEKKPPAEKFLTAAELEELEKDKKPKDAFMALPKGSFDMDEWKRMISNNDPKTVALPWLWEHVDKEHYSFWTCKYLYPEELKMLFMTSNSIGGMFQRLEKMRKHAFGVMCIFGEDKKNDIRGVWLWRGQGLAFELDEDLQLDYDLYKWEKLDVKKADDKKMIDQYFAQDFAGTNFNQSKVYK
jgi:elongation factor 1-gamma